MACIVVIYDGTDSAELAIFEQICQEANPETGTACKRLSPNAFWLYSWNVSEIKVARLKREIQKGRLFCMRMEDDDFERSGGAAVAAPW